MNEITKETLTKALKPFDVVSDERGNVGLVQEVSVNACQVGFENQVSYSIKWLTGNNTKQAWFVHHELTLHCNLFVAIAECSCHPMGNNDSDVQTLFNNMDR